MQITSIRSEALRLSGVDQGITALCRGIVDESGAPVADLGGRLRSGEWLASLGAPFAAVLVEHGRATIAADHVGLRHIYGARLSGWAAVSTSATRLAQHIQSATDVTALSVFRLAGHYLDDETAYAGVRKLPPAHSFTLRNGSLESATYEIPSRATVDDPAAAHARRLRALVSGFLDHHPDVMIELSGGLDSRMVLAAIPPRRRSSLTAFTIAGAGSGDAPVAEALARRYGMRFRRVDISGLASLTPEQAYEMAFFAAARQDGLGRPLSAAAFRWVEAQVEQAPRLSGHGGEMARALFGPGVEFERPHATASPEVVESYIRRWIVANDGVPDEALTPSFAAESYELGMRRLREAFQRPGLDWSSCLRDFYLRQRMHRFGGITITDGCDSRVTLNPLADASVLAIVDGVPYRARAGSRYAVRVLDRLDPELARIPLGSGLRPIVLDRPVTLARRLGENTVRGFIRKAGDKAVRTLNSRRRPAAGASLLAELVVAHWRSHPSLLGAVARSGLVSEDYLSRLIEGTVEADATVVDFVLNLAVISRVNLATVDHASRG